jgi:hypothetical protein
MSVVFISLYSMGGSEVFERVKCVEDGPGGTGIVRRHCYFFDVGGSPDTTEVQCHFHTSFLTVSMSALPGTWGSTPLTLSIKNVVASSMLTHSSIVVKPNRPLLGTVQEIEKESMVV